MSMTKQDFIWLAATLYHHRPKKADDEAVHAYYNSLLEVLADCCEHQNERFNRRRWLESVKGVRSYTGKKRGSYRGYDQLVEQKLEQGKWEPLDSQQEG